MTKLTKVFPVFLLIGSLLCGCGSMSPDKAGADEFTVIPEPLPQEVVDAIIGGEEQGGAEAGDIDEVEAALGIYAGIGSSAETTLRIYANIGASAEPGVYAADAIVIVFAAVGVDENGNIRAVAFNGAAGIVTPPEDGESAPSLRLAEWRDGEGGSTEKLKEFDNLDEALAYCDSKIFESGGTDMPCAAFKRAAEAATLSPITTSAEVVLSLGLYNGAEWDGNGSYKLTSAACALSATKKEDGGTIMAADFERVAAAYKPAGEGESEDSFTVNTDVEADDPASDGIEMSLVGRAVADAFSDMPVMPEDYTEAFTYAAEWFK